MCLGDSRVIKSARNLRGSARKVEIPMAMDENLAMVFMEHQTKFLDEIVIIVFHSQINRGIV